MQRLESLARMTMNLRNREPWFDIVKKTKHSAGTSEEDSGSTHQVMEYQEVDEEPSM